jgi:hypothetical protein
MSDIELLLNTHPKSMSKYVKYSHTEETKAYLKSRGNAWSNTKVQTPMGVFDSIKEAAKACGLSPNAFGNRMKSGVPGYEYITPKKVCSAQQKKKISKATKGREAAWTKKAIRTPKGVFDSVKEAAIAYNLFDGTTIRRWIRWRVPGFEYANPEEQQKIIEQYPNPYVAPEKKPYSQETKQKMKASSAKRWQWDTHARAKKVRTPLGVFDSITAANKAHGVSNIGSRIKKGKPGYEYV